jgi:hypothetical protein
MKNLKRLFILFVLLIPLSGSAQLFGPPTDSTYKRTIAVKQEFLRLLNPVSSWQTSVEIRLFSNFSFESEFNIYRKFKYEEPNDLLSSFKAELSNKLNFFTTGILKIHLPANSGYLGIRGGLGKVSIRYQRVVCLETLVSPGGLCECINWESVDITREMNQYLWGVRLGKKFTILEKVVVDLYIDYVVFQYNYPEESQPLQDASCEGAIRTRNPLRKLTDNTSGRRVDNMFLAKSGMSTEYVQFGIKIGYVF